MKNERKPSHRRSWELGPGHSDWDVSSARHCEELHTHFSAYIDKELPAWKRLLIRQHLKRCPNCAFHVRRLEQTDRFLRAEAPLPASDDFAATVITRAAEMHQHQRQHRSIFHRVGQFIEASLGWARHHVWTHISVYTFALCFAVFTMVGVTLYAPSGERFDSPAQARLDTTEKLISFEVIRDEQPKRSLKVPQLR